MANTYAWVVTKLTGYPQIDGDTDVITVARCDVFADDGQGHIASIPITQATPLDPAVPFIPYSDLTNEIVVGWVQNNLGANGVASVYANLDSQIENQINPPEVTESFPLPWGSSTGTVSNYVPPAPVAEIVPQVVVTEPASSDSLTESPVVIETSDPTN